MNLKSSRRTMVILGVIACLLLALGLATGICSTANPAAASPAVRYVTPGGSESGDCTPDWANACTLQHALDIAVADDEIWVAAGIHCPAGFSAEPLCLSFEPDPEYTATFALKSGVAVYGGFAGSETSRDQRNWNDNVTVLSGHILDLPTAIEYHVYHVVTGSGTDGTAVLDGFTVTAGKADGSDPHDRGGGMYNDSGNPTLSNVTFSGNSAGWDGGGMYNHNSSPTLIDISFEGNESGGAGGGMTNASSSPTLVNVAFSGNSASGDGGGMHNYWGSSPMLVNVTFSGNSAYAGGGMDNWDTSSPILVNVVFSANDAFNHGGGIANRGGSSSLTNCILWGNTAGLEGDQIYNDGTGTATVTYSDIEGGYAGDDNIDANPQFVDPDGPDDTPGTLDDNLRLRATSPAIDAGDNDAVPPDTLDLDGDENTAEKLPLDLDGRPRIVNGTVDMGAYEHQLFHAKVGASGDCSSWANACDLQTALGTAWEGAGDEIWVETGVYTPTTTGTDRTATFQLKNAVAVYGGFEGTETSREQRDWEGNITALSGDIDNNDIADPNGVVTTTSNITGTNSYHVVTGSGTYSTTILDGFTITAGNADGSSPDNRGGGMYNWDSSPTLTNVTFSGNSATYGGGMHNYGGSSPMLVNVTFSGNEAGWGGGMDNWDTSSPTLTNVTFSGNSADYYGGGMYNYESSPTLTNVTFSGNSAYSGGGMHNASSSPALTNVTFSGNSADYGGGMDNWDTSSPTLTNVTFSGNSSDSYGGGVYNNNSDPTLVNVTFSGNSADSDGGGMYNWDSSATLVNVTFSGNSADIYGGGMYNTISSPTLTNCILWGNTAPVGPQIYNYGGSATVTYSDIQGGYTGDGNIAEDPEFVDPDGADDIVGTLDDNLRLQLISPAIDAGDNTALPADTLDLDEDGDTTEPLPIDLDGYPRCVDIPSRPDTGVGPGPIVDMGACEAQVKVYLPLVMKSYAP